MPERFHIKTVPTSGRFRRVGRCATVDWREDCSRCTNCVKLRCTYDVYLKARQHDADPACATEPLYDCKGCLSCVQNCTKGLLTMAISPEYLAMGDEYWTPAIIASTWEQADAGRIPVSGAGYRGRFSGPGFDSIWTDMSEIVRPTRDGIHGREYISTSVDIGPKPMRLNFGADGEMLTPEFELLVTQLPAILDIPPWPLGASGPALAAARAAAAKALHTLCVARPADLAAVPAELLAWVVPLLGKALTPVSQDLLGKVRMVELPDGPDVRQLADAVRAVNPALMTAVRMDLGAGAAQRVSDLARQGLKIIHVCADLHGREHVADNPRHIRDVLREVHGRLVADGIRDEVTLIVTGGIALPEHLAKAIICGADLVALDAPMLIALGCRLCRSVHAADGSAATAGEEACPAEIGMGDVAYASQRMINLMGAWHSQMIEVLGAMGIREVRRLRGEVGRAIFQEEIEREAFGDLVRR